MENVGYFQRYDGSFDDFFYHEVMVFSLVFLLDDDVKKYYIESMQNKFLLPVPLDDDVWKYNNQSM